MRLGQSNAGRAQVRQSVGKGDPRERSQAVFSPCRMRAGALRPFASPSSLLPLSSSRGHCTADGMKPPTAIIAEDEPVLRAELKETLSKLWPELVVCAEVEDGIEALHALQTHAPEILFLDIQMPGMSG